MYSWWSWSLQYITQITKNEPLTDWLHYHTHCIFSIFKCFFLYLDRYTRLKNLRIFYLLTLSIRQCNFFSMNIIFLFFSFYTHNSTYKNILYSFFKWVIYIFFNINIKIYFFFYFLRWHGIISACYCCRFPFSIKKARKNAEHKKNTPPFQQGSTFHSRRRKKSFFVWYCCFLWLRWWWYV